MTIDEMIERCPDIVKITPEIMIEVSNTKLNLPLDINKTWADNGYDDLDGIEMVMELEKILVEPIESENIKFSYFDINNEEIAEYQETDKDLIHTADFLNEESNQENTIITKKVIANSPSSSNSRPSSPNSRPSSPNSRPSSPNSRPSSPNLNPRPGSPLDPKNNRKYYHSTKYQIEPKDMNMVITRDELDRHMNKLYLNWRQKLIEKNKINMKLGRYTTIVDSYESDLKKRTSILDNIQRIKTELAKTTTESIIRKIYNDKQLDMDEVLKILEISTSLEKELATTDTVIGIHKERCNQIMDRFKAFLKTNPNAELNHAEGTECRYEDLLTSKYTSLKPLLQTIRGRIIDLNSYTRPDEEAKAEQIRIGITKIDERIQYLVDGEGGLKTKLDVIKSQYIDSVGLPFVLQWLNRDPREARFSVLYNVLLNLGEGGQTMYQDQFDKVDKTTYSYLLRLKTSERYPMARDLFLVFIASLKEVSNLELSKRYIKTKVLSDPDKDLIISIISNLTKFSQNISGLTSIQIGGALPVTSKTAPTYKTGDGNINLFIDQLNEFEKVIRTMVKERKAVIKLIKLYNVRYTQFYNFQKYIVNYVSLKLAKKEYKYYNYLSKGTISFYESVLEKMEKIIDKYEDPKSFSDNELPKKENQNLYGRHYFMIKIFSGIIFN
jgi:hypothetical protein